MRIDKDGHLCVVPRYSERVPEGLELASECLNSLLGRTLVEDDQTALCITLEMTPTKELVEPTAKLFESDFRDILARKILLFEDRRKKPHMTLGPIANPLLQRIKDRLFAVGFRKSTPPSQPGPHWMPVQFNQVRLIVIEALRDLVERSFDPVRFAFKHSQSG